MKKYLALIWLVLLGVAIYYLRDFAINNSYSIGEALKEIIKILQDYIADAGIYAGIIYILIYTIRPLIFFPTSILTPVSAVLFGPVLGWIFTYIGENFSASVAFFVGRYFGGGVTEKFKILKKLDGSISESPFITVLFLRMVPLFPFDFVNFGLGVTKIPFRWYILGTLLGVIPGLTAYIFLGTSITNPIFLIPTIIFFVILISTSWYIKKRSSLAKKLKKELEENK